MTKAPPSGAFCVYGGGSPLELFGTVAAPTLWEFEDVIMRRGYHAVAGVDEAGRGPLAGPVVASAVILRKDVEIQGVNDSKTLSSAKREELYSIILERAVAVGVGIADNVLIDRINILQATLDAMKMAIMNMAVTPDYLLVDGITPIPLSIPQKTIKKGDSASFSIAAASIVAKVTRDRLMVSYDRQFPVYGFAKHKGYGSASHLAAIAEHGPCEIHRKSFRGVREHVGSKG